MPTSSETNESRPRGVLPGLIGVRPKIPVSDAFALSVIYTPGVAEPCKEIARDAAASYIYTWRWNAMAVVGSRRAGGRLVAAAIALRNLAGLDAVPLVIDATDGGAAADVLRRIVPTFGMIWLLGFGVSEAERIIEELATVGIPVLPPPRDAGHGLGDPSVYPGLLRALLDLRVGGLDTRLVLEAVHADDESELSFGSAPRVARAVAEKAVELGLGQAEVSPEAVERRLLAWLDTGVIRPFERGGDWLAAGSLREHALRLHAGLGGTLEMESRFQPRDPSRLVQLLEDASDVAEPAGRLGGLADDVGGAANRVAVVTDGTAVLGLGDIGARAGLPVMLGKGVLFKTFGGCDAIPICVDAKDPQLIIETVEALAPSFGGINLEDISAPRCFEIEDELVRRLDIFVFHDDQHGTAVVTLAALLNAARLCEKSLSELTVTFNGAGAAGIATTKLLLAAGVQDVILCDRSGPIYEGRAENMNPTKDEIARLTNRDRVRGTLADAVRGRNVFIGLSVAGALTGEMVRRMAERPVIFAMANPVPEIMPAEAYAAGAIAVATGRSDFPNQVNNCLGFPGIFRGALDVRAKSINTEMKLAAARAIASLVGEGQLRPDYFIPTALDLRVPPAVAAAIARAAIETGEARVAVVPDAIAARTRRFLYEGVLE